MEQDLDPGENDIQAIWEISEGARLSSGIVFQESLSEIYGDAPSLFIRIRMIWGWAHTPIAERQVIVGRGWRRRYSADRSANAEQRPLRRTK
jgi:hypothetical protein